MDEDGFEPEDGAQYARSARLPGVALLLRRTRWIALGALLGLVVGIGAALTQQPMYASTAVVTVTSTGPSDLPSLARAAQAMARLATQPSVVAVPLRTAGLPDVAADPRGFVTVQAAPDAPVITVTGTADQPTTAQRTARIVSATLASLGTVPPFRATVVATASLPTAPTTPKWLVPVGGLAIGLLLSLVIATTLPAKERFNPDRGPAVTPAPAAV